MSVITVDGITRDINRNAILLLAKENLPSGMSAGFKKEFVNEVVFLMADLEVESEFFNGFDTAEEYYFYTCLAYCKDNGYEAFFEEVDSTKIFDYCGASTLITVKAEDVVLTM